MLRKLFFINESLFYYFVDLSKDTPCTCEKKSPFTISLVQTDTVLKVQAALLTRRQ